MGTILCVIDGMTGGGFRVSEYPHLAAMQYVKDVQTIPDGYETESLTGILTLLGVSPVPRNIRGWVEAVGAGIPVRAEDLVFRGSWVLLDQNDTVTGLADACASADKAVSVGTPTPAVLPGGLEYHPQGSYKSILIWRGMAHALEGVRTVPPHDSTGLPYAALLPAGSEPLCRVIRSARRGRLALVPWAQSCAAPLPPFPARAAVVCGAGIMRGIGRVLGMEILDVPGATGDTDTNLEGKARAAVDAAPAYDCVVLHINGADEAGHRRDCGEKERFLGAVDRIVIRHLLDSGYPCIVASDHGTDCATGKHLAGKQPVFIAGKAKAFAQKTRKLF